MVDVARKGRTVLFVSHNMAAVRNLCTWGIQLDGGRITFVGPMGAAIDRYLQSVESADEVPLADRKNRKGDGSVRVESIRFRNGDGDAVEVLQSGEPASICLDYSSGDDRPLGSVLASVSIDTLQGTRVCILQSDYVGANFSRLPPKGTFICEIPKLTLNSGLYQMTTYVVVNGQIADWIPNATIVRVVAGDFFGTGKIPDKHDGHIFLEHTWRAAE